MQPRESPPTEFDQVEIRIFQGRVAKYRVEMRMATDRVVGHRDGLPPLDRVTDVGRYGKDLFEWLFHGDLRDAFQRARWNTESYNRSATGVTGLRLRLWIEPGCEDLHTIKWEALTDPARDEPLALTTAFSRSVSVSKPAAPPRGRPLRLLLITSNPEGLSRFDLTSIDVELERRIVQGAIGVAGQRVEVTRLGPRVTLEDIHGAEKQGFQITHLVAHAVSVGERGYVLLGDSSGSVRQVTCEDIAAAIVSPLWPPALVYIATPTEGDVQDAPTRLDLGRLLLEAGVQAVVVIQAPIDLENFSLFTERFYSVLVQTGSVDHAMADARVAIYRPDSWGWAYPVLFMRADARELWAPEIEGFETLIKGIRTER